jgi:adenylate cyclase
MPTAEITRSAAARLEAAIHAETVRSLKLAAIARTGLAVALTALLGAMWQEWFAVSWWAALIFLFAAFGAAQWALAASRHHRGWHAYLFTTLDAALIAFGLLWPNPLGPPMTFDIQMLTRSYTFVFFTLLVATSALSFSWRVVLYAGAACSVSWAIGVLAIAARPESVTDWNVAYSWWDPASRELFLNPRFVAIRGMIQETAVLTLSAAVLAIAVSRANALMRRHARAEGQRSMLARYFSPNMVEEIATLDRPLGTVRSQDAGVLFADIVGFTTLSERLGAEATMALLRDFHRRMAEVVFAHDGTVDKYIGDAIMATFGTPRPRPDDALRAVRCALAMLEATAAWNAERARAGEPPIEIGIGLHYGPVVAGDLGDERRLEYAVIGDTVNLASRLEALTRARGVSALISDDAVAAARAAPAGAGSAGCLAALAPAGTATVRGRAAPVALWAPAAAAP